MLWLGLLESAGIGAETYVFKLQAPERALLLAGIVALAVDGLLLESARCESGGLRPEVPRRERENAGCCEASGRCGREVRDRERG